MAFVASCLATVPTSGFDWYVFYLEHTWDDPIKQQLLNNFQELGRRVGPNALVVRGYDAEEFAREVADAAGLLEERSRKIQPPALLVSSHPLQVLADPAELAKAKLIVLPLTSKSLVAGSIPSILESIVKAVRDPEAMKALQKRERSNIKKYWGWTRWFELKPNFFGLGLNINQILDDALE